MNDAKTSQETEGIQRFAPYETALDVADDLRALVKIWIERHILLYRERYQKQGGSYSDLYVGRDEVDAFLAGQLGVEGQGGAPLQESLRVEAAFREYMEARQRAGAKQGFHSPFARVVQAFEVDDERVADILAALLLAELDPEFLRAYAYAWADFTQKHVDVGFLLELVCRNHADRARILGFFAQRDHALFRYGVLQMPPFDGTSRKSLVGRPVWLAPRIVEVLVGREFPGAAILGARGRFTPIQNVDCSLDRVLMGTRTKAEALSALQALRDETVPERALVVYGPDGAGKRTLCQAAAAALHMPTLTANWVEISSAAGGFEERLLELVREARLQGAALLIQQADAAWPARGGAEGPEPTSGATDRLAALDSVLRAAGAVVCFLASQRVPALSDQLGGLLEVSVPHPPAAAQVELWNRLLPPHLIFEPPFTTQDIVDRYSLSGGAIAAVARRLAAARRSHGGSAQPALTAGEILPLVRDQLRHRLGSVATPVERGFGWRDLVVPPQTRRALEEIVSYVRNRETIVKQWGFGAKVAYGRGVAALFHGPPGTGKTMAASIVGNELAMEIFQVDLSRIVDKYIGETEKNLARVFEEGSRAQAILLFDEADSLFSKRTSVKSSVDRYANLEVNFLLQMMESYEGISILTSNFPESIDDAFKRRIRFKVEFPFPNQEEREHLWQAMIPPEAPVDTDVYFDELAERFELSGAHIKNAILRAAAMAADKDGRMSHDVFVRAAKREYLELGKLVQTSEYDADDEDV